MYDIIHPILDASIELPFVIDKDKNYDDKYLARKELNPTYYGTINEGVRTKNLEYLWLDSAMCYNNQHIGL